MLVIRADASKSIGAGHLARCICLAQSWKRRGGKVIILSSEIMPPLEHRAVQSGISVQRMTAKRGSEEDISNTVKLTRAENCNWLVLDGYCFGLEYQSGVKQSRSKILLIDDSVISGDRSCNILLNQNINAKADDYRHRIERTTKLLLGPTFALIGEEFQSETCILHANLRSPSRVLVCLGGGDSREALIEVLKAMNLFNNEKLKVWVLSPGSNSRWFSEHAKSSKLQIKFLSRWTEGIGKLIRSVDLAIIGGGHTTWEVLSSGVPAAVLVVADNQKPNVEELDRRGVICNLGSLESTSAMQIANTLMDLVNNTRKLKQMIRMGRELVDGFGVDRVVNEMQRFE